LRLTECARKTYAASIQRLHPFLSASSHWPGDSAPIQGRRLCSHRPGTSRED
jgi:hypothetical protein